MPVLIPSPEQETIVPEPHPKRKRWTREELRQLIEEGHREFERYELFDGELIDKMGKNRPHVLVVRSLTILLQQVFGSEFVLSETPINLRPEERSTYRPEPDVLVLEKPYKHFALDDPGPQDIVLLVEVADTSLQYDLVSKARAYARAAIREYWVADLVSHRVIVHRQPLGERYALVQAFDIGEAVSFPGRDASPVSIDAVFDGIL